MKTKMDSIARARKNERIARRYDAIGLHEHAAYLRDNKHFRISERGYRSIEAKLRIREAKIRDPFNGIISYRTDNPRNARYGSPSVIFAVRTTHIGGDGELKPAYRNKEVN